MASKSEINKTANQISKKIEEKYSILRKYGVFSDEVVKDLVSQTVEVVEKADEIALPKDSVEGRFSTLSYSDILNEVLKYDFKECIMGGVPDSVINSSEKDLGYIFPDSFKEYLRVFGCFNNGAHEYVGYGQEQSTEELMSITSHCRRVHGLPRGYLCLEYDTDVHYTSCIDFTLGGGDDAQIVWYLYDEQRFDGVQSINFDIYFRNEMKYLIQAHETS